MMSLQSRPDIARIAVLWCFMLAITPGMASAWDAPRHKPAPAIYLQIVPIANATGAVISEDEVARMAQASLAELGQTAIRVDDRKSPPVGALLLRILYIVHDQSQASGTTLSASASASTVLLRAVVDQHRRLRMDSVYDGLQQTLVQGPVESTAVDKLRDHFRQELQARIASAFAASSAQ